MRALRVTARASRGQRIYVTSSEGMFIAASMHACMYAVQVPPPHTCMHTPSELSTLCGGSIAALVCGLRPGRACKQWAQSCSCSSPARTYICLPLTPHPLHVSTTAGPTPLITHAAPRSTNVVMGVHACRPTHMGSLRLPLLEQLKYMMVVIAWRGCRRIACKQSVHRLQTKRCRAACPHVRRRGQDACAYGTIPSGRPAGACMALSHHPQRLHGQQRVVMLVVVCCMQLQQHLALLGGGGGGCVGLGGRDEHTIQHVQNALHGGAAVHRQGGKVTCFDPSTYRMHGMALGRIRVRAPATT